MITRLARRGIFNFLKDHQVEHVISDQASEQEGFPKESHYPVQFQNTIELIRQNLFPQAETGSSDNYKSLLDCTLGTGGHVKKLIQTFPNLYILGIDLDHRMLDLVKRDFQETLKPEEAKRFEAKHSNFRDIDKIFPYQGFPEEFVRKQKFDCILADLGYNSVQLGEDWGLAYNSKQKLDMRYDKEAMKTSAEDLVNKIPLYELKEIFTKFGEEPAADFLARTIVKERKTKKIETAQDLKDIIWNNMNPRANRHKTVMRVFQALRIAVNGELDNLEVFMEKVLLPLKPDGLGIIITFHSLEREIVINKLKELKRQEKVKLLEMNRVPSEEEININSKSKSAQLFCFQKLK